MTVDREIEEIIASFNPGVDVSDRSSSTLHPELKPVDPWNILKIDSDGCFYRALISSVVTISNLVQADEAETTNNRECNKIFATRVLLGMAARDRALSRSDIQRIERDYAAYMPFSDVLWRELDLFRAVCRLTDALGVRRPELLQDERRTWGRLFLRRYTDSVRTNARSSVLLPDHLKEVSLSKRQNPSALARTLDENLNETLIVDYALHLADWDDSDIKLSHSASRDRARLRKDIRQKIENYETALNSLEIYSDSLSNLEVDKISGS